tara:strand:+ start:441 stop:935 length:495 start_codon:yes stop_codon:yes gene_type:complete
MNYKVGQVFYLVGSETARVIPFRVVEEITRTTLEGIEKSFIAEMPDKGKTKVDVVKLKGAIFGNIKQVRMHMLANAEQAIDKMLTSAMKISEHVYSTSVAYSSEMRDNYGLAETEADAEAPGLLDSEEDENDVQEALKSDIIKVDIGNGLMATMNTANLDKVRV